MSGIKCKFQNLFRSMSLRARFMGIALILILILGLGFALQVHRAIYESLEGYLVRTGVSLARAVAARSEDFILTNNLYQLHMLVGDTMDSNPDVAYLFILGTEGETIASSFPLSLPSGLREVNTLETPDLFNVQTIRTERGLVDDIAVPVLAGRAGTVRMGILRQGIQDILVNMLRQSLGMSLLASLAGIALAYILVTLALKPVVSLADAMEIAGRGDFSQRVSAGMMDEVGKLTQAFNTMLDRLSQLTEESRQYQQDLERKEYLRRQLQEKIISTQEEERKRISRELHDETGQSLTSLKLVLKKISEAEDLEQAKRLAGEMREMLTEAVESLKNLSRDLRPSVLDDMGLIVALKKYLEDASKRLNLVIDFHVQGLENWQPDPLQSITIYRVVQEALTNVAKHAKAGNVSVIIEKQRQKIVVIVEDDGVGFDRNPLEYPGSGELCLGIFGMQERAALVRGELVVETAPGKGTTLYFKIPLEKGGEING